MTQEALYLTHQPGMMSNPSTLETVAPHLICQVIWAPIFLKSYGWGSVNDFWSLRQMYWTDTGTVDKIEGASMDGTSRRVIHSTSLSLPYGLTLDIDTQTLYWTDYSRNVLERSSVDGTNRETLTSRMISDPYFLTYYDGNLYWGDWAYNRLLTTSISSPNNVRFFGSSTSADVYGIHVVSPEKQRLGQLVN